MATPAFNIRKLIVDYTAEEFDQVVNLNLKGAFHFMRRFSAPMMKQGSGSLILCSSMRAVTIEPGLGIYAATKAGIAQMVKGFASEVGSYITGSSLSVDGRWTAIDGPPTGLTATRPSE